MITISQIRNGGGYMRNHLSANDYYSESEKVTGQWHGKAARMLGLEGMSVTDTTFEALRSNRHPETGAKLTPRGPKVAFHDFVISAPKSASIAAMVGGDKRIIEAFDRCVLRAFDHLESFASIRVRVGKAYHTEEVRRTGNAVVAVFRHDTSRLLDPQLHTHLVFANMSWDEQSQRWLALQPKVMAEQSKEWIRAEFYREFAGECRSLGYSVEGDGEAFRLSGIEPSIDHAFSQRSLQRERFEERYQKLFEHQPDKKRVGQFIKDHKATATRRFKEEYQARFGKSPTKEEITGFVQDWRSSKMARSTREKVHALQQGRISPDQAEIIRSTVSQAQNIDQEMKQDAPSIQQNEEVISIQSDDKPTLQHTVLDNNNRKKSTKPARSHQEKSTDKKQKMHRLKTAREIAASLQGHPTKLMARRIQKLARQRHGTQRRIR